MSEIYTNFECPNEENWTLSFERILEILEDLIFFSMVPKTSVTTLSIQYICKSVPQEYAGYAIILLVYLQQPPWQHTGMLWQRWIQNLVSQVST